MTTGASWPWNLSTVPTRTPGIPALGQAADLGVVGRDDEDVLAGHLRVLPSSSIQCAPGAVKLRDKSRDDFDLLDRRVAIAVVVDVDHPQAAAVELAGAGER